MTVVRGVTVGMTDCVGTSGVQEKDGVRVDDTDSEKQEEGDAMVEGE